ncbi:MAG: GNAT family N-acetyltransferase [Ilumatobacter fluminis]|uniref:GNAT family N-acetyltransferase n=1 Tax=Ilumatobacter fluminis TaxID=467091 RepID=UPI0032EAFDAF
MTIVFRATQPDELRRAAVVVTTALMGSPPSDDDWNERGQASWEEMPSYTAWDDDRCVGHVGHFLVETVVPGGTRLGTGAVSRVGVLPTYRRRGIAKGLMHELVADADRRGLPLMSLRASEATIYERFGFGLAGEFCGIELIPRQAAPIRGAAADGSMRLLRPDEIVDVLPDLYDRVAFGRPGVITRPASWYRRLFKDAIEGSKASFVAVHTNADGIDDGYIHYENEWDDGHADGPTGKGEVYDAYGATPATELALWQYLCDVDLVTRWKATERPIDDLVRTACHNTRAYRVRSVDDEQWLRLIDVDTALAARTYSPADGEVAIRVTDPLLPRNDGTFVISADGARRDDAAEADIVTDIVGLSAAYLGGTSWFAVTATGRASTGDPASIALADTLFRTTPGPFCGTFF